MLVAFRKPFIPPTTATPLIVRSLNYQGEPHPVTIKRVIVAALDELPLKGENALHKFKLLAGPRWTPVPPADGGVSELADWGNGFIKISCEDFPKPSMNLKWASDTLNKLISEANVRISALWLPLFFAHFPFRIRQTHSVTCRSICVTPSRRQKRQRKETTLATGCTSDHPFVISLKSGYHKTLHKHFIIVQINSIREQTARYVLKHAYIHLLATFP